MGIFDRFPYSSTHEMNLDFMLGKATEIAEDMQTVTTGMAQVQAGLSAISEKTEQATQAAAQAAQSASSIEGSVTAAEEAAEEAQMHNESAQTWANNAMTYKADCQRSATEAAASATSAAQAATAAAGSEDTVAQYAQAANASAQSAANNNDSAHQYANQASASASNATFHSSNAQTAATNAQTAATNAQTAADRAASLKTDVETLHRMCTAAVDQAATEAVNAANSAAQAAATKTDVETLVESLPEDFTDLNNTVNQLSDEIDALDGDVTDLQNESLVITLSKSDVIALKDTTYNGKLFNIGRVLVGVTKITDSSILDNSTAYNCKIPLAGVEWLQYPLFKSSSNGGCLICDSENTIIWAYSNATEETGTVNSIKIPNNASYFMLTVSASLQSLDYSVTKYMADFSFMNDDEESASPFVDVDRNITLCGIKTDITNNKIPYHRGFLFHSLTPNDRRMWYGNSFDDVHQIKSLSFNPQNKRFAISPKDGRIIATRRDMREGIWIWDGTNTTLLNQFTINPMGWLYNSGVDFIVNGDDEYCIFAEYKGSASSDGYNVWRGKYPYTSATDWEIVMTKTSSDITHFHQVRRDPWTNILYLTSGDSSAESKWWYSSDYGATWTLLVDGSDAEWGNSLCRTINFIFTSDYIYWATDHGENQHTLNRIQRNGTTGVIDLTTKEKLTDLPGLRATNSICYVESPHGLFMYDRIDMSPSSEFGQPITMQFWDIDAEELKNVVTLNLTSNTWGGSRGKCYINYTNSKQPMPAMGFSVDTPCIFDLVCDNPSNIGTIAYDVGSRTVRTIEY